MKLVSAWSRYLEITPGSNVKSSTSQELVCTVNPFPPGRLLELMLKSENWREKKKPKKEAPQIG